MNRTRLSTADYFIYGFLALAALSMLYPFWYVLMGSLMTVGESAASTFKLFVKNPTLNAYRMFFNSIGVISNFTVSVYVAVVGALASLFFTSMAGYALSRKYLPARSLLMKFIVVTMLFSGGLIPFYMVVRYVGLINRLEVLIIPVLVNAFYLILMRTYFSTLPDSLEESAKMDGANDFTILFRIILPLSAPILATIGLFTAVDRWNDILMGLIFIDDTKLQPMQVLLFRILAQMDNQMMGDGASTVLNNSFMNARTLQHAAIIVTIGPIIAVYPFLQRYFIKGMLIGSLKE